MRSRRLSLTTGCARNGRLATTYRIQKRGGPGPVPLGTRKLELALQSPLATVEKLRRLAGRRQRGKQRAPTSCAPRPGWRRLARLFESQFLYLPTYSRLPGPRQRALSARLGDSFYFARCEIVESLLRRGARTHRVFCWPTGCNLHCPRAGGNRSNNVSCLIDFLLQQSRAGRAIPTSKNCAQAARAPLTPRRRAHRAFYWPSGRENRLRQRAASDPPIVGRAVGGAFCCGCRCRSHRQRRRATKADRRGS